MTFSNFAFAGQPPAFALSALGLAEERYAQRKAKQPHHFLSLAQHSPQDFADWIALGRKLKQNPEAFKTALKDKKLALLFEKTSTRTRCSFETGAQELGMIPTTIDWKTSNFARAALEDETIVLSRFYDCIMARVNAHKTLETMAAHSEVPVINGLSDFDHPCQALADFLTISEYFGSSFKGLCVAYIGDGNNVCRALLYASILAGATFVMASPNVYALQDPCATEENHVFFAPSPQEAVKCADIVYTDTWVSMGDEAETAERLKAFQGFQVNEDLMDLAPSHALFMHCLPAHVGEEVTAGVLRSPRSIVFDQAENRKHAQKALLLTLMEDQP